MYKATNFIRKCQILAAFFCISYLHAQQNFSFESFYKLPTDSIQILAKETVPDREGGYYWTGILRYPRKESTGYNLKLYIARIDCAGQPLWMRALDSIPFYYGNGFEYLSIQTVVLQDRVIMTRGFHHPGIVSLSPEGEVLEQKELYLSTPDSTCIVTGIKQLPDGRWILTGGCGGTPFGPLIDRYNKFIMLTDKDFNTVWSRLSDDRTINRFRKTYRSAILTDDRYIYFVDDYQTTWFYLIKTDYDGNIIYYKDYRTYKLDLSARINFDQPAVLDNGYIYTIAKHNAEQSIDDLYFLRIKAENGEIDKASYFARIKREGSGHLNRASLSIKDHTITLLTRERINNYSNSLLFKATLDTGFVIKKIEKLEDNNATGELKKDRYYFYNYPHMENNNIYATIGYVPYNDLIYYLGGIFVSKRSLKDNGCAPYYDATDEYRIDPVPPSEYTSYDHRPLYIFKGPWMRDYRETCPLVPLSQSYLCFDKGFEASIRDGASAIYCVGDTVMLFPAAGLDRHDISWMLDGLMYPDDGGFRYSPVDTGSHTVRLIASDGCFSDTSAAFRFMVVTPDTTEYNEKLCPGDTLILQDKTVTSAGTYTVLRPGTVCDSVLIYQVDEWETYDIVVDTTLCKGEVFEKDGQSVTADTALVFHYTSSNDCDSILRYNLHFDPACDKCLLRLPMAFTPNGDNLNDALRLINPCNIALQSADWRIYNRWGNVVYASDNPTGTWDGKYKSTDVPAGVYLVMLSARLASGEELRIRQDITLIR